MSQDESKDNIRLPEEIGVHNSAPKIDTKSVKNKYEFTVQTETVFQRLSEDIYNGKEAGLREPLTNSITSVIRASKNDYIQRSEEGIIKIELHDYDDSVRLKIRDNGLGITREEIDKIISVIGTSSSRSITNITGKFGMGFLATWILTGDSTGGFIMHTNPRGSEQGPISGIWNSDGFTEIDKNKLVGGLNKTEYGTELDILVAENIDTENLIDWINKYSEWSRVPILFEHHTGDEIIDNEFIPEKLSEKYKKYDSDGFNKNKYKIESRNKFYSNFKYHKIQTEYFTAINSNLIDKFSNSGFLNKIVLDIPIQSNYHTVNYPLPSLEIRFHTETPVVVSGPHKGKFVASEADKLGEDFIHEKELSVDDIVTPSPTGTRDILQNEEKFDEWLGDKMYEIYYRDISSEIRDINSFEDYCNSSKNKISKFHEIIEKIKDNKLTVKEINRIESKSGISFESNFKNILPLLHENKVSFAPENKTGVSKSKNRSMVPARNIILDTHNTDKEVYMGHRISQNKADFVWESETEHVVVQVNSSEQEKYRKHFGWKKLSNISYEEDLSMNTKTRNKFSSDKVNLSTSYVTIHVGEYGQTKDILISELKKRLENNSIISVNDKTYDINKLILFKYGGERLLESKNIVGDIVSVAKVKKEVYDYLIDIDKCKGASSIINQDTRLIASDGKKYDLGDDYPINVVLHVVDSETISDFRNPKFMKRVQDFLREKSLGPKSPVYLPATPLEINYAGYTTKQNKWMIDTQEYRYHNYNYLIKYINSDVQLYIESKYGSNNKPEIDALKSTSAKWSNGGKELVKLVEDYL